MDVITLDEKYYHVKLGTFDRVKWVIIGERRLLSMNP